MSRYYHSVALIAVLIALIMSCDINNDSSGEGTGILFIKVVNSSGDVMSGAEISTSPATGTYTTDEMGTATIRDVPFGEYTVAATVEEIGSGKQAVIVQNDEVSNVTVELVPGVYFSFTPTVEIILPESPAGFAEGEEITFSAEVSDPETAPIELDIRWISDKDGELNNTPPDEDGLVSFKTSTLTPAKHLIRLDVTDSDGHVSADSIEIVTLFPKAVELSKPQKEEGKIMLEWSLSDSDNFQKYEIFRRDMNGEKLIDTITDRLTTTTVDELPPISSESYYSVHVINERGFSRSSNEQRVENPGGLIVDFVPFDAVHHPTKPYLYLLNKDEGKIVVANYETMEIVEQTTMDGTFGFMDIGDNGYGIELYLPGKDGFVYILDAETLAQKTVINTGVANTCIVIDNRGHVYVSLLPSPWWEQPIRTYERSSGSHIDGGGDFDGDRIRMFPNRMEVLTITTSVAPTDMEYILFNENAEFVEHSNDSYHGDHPLDPHIFRISTNGEFAVTAAAGAVYTANSNMDYLGQIQHGSLQFSDFAFSDDGTTIYAATSNRKSIQIATYPELTRQSEILTRGFPSYIFRKGDKLIGLSKGSEHGNIVGIDIVDIDQ